MNQNDTVPDISVVIPAYNEEGYIGACLRSLQQQKTERTFEVIVVDNASSDHTAQEIQQNSAGLNVRLVPEPQKGRGAARAAGFAAAQGSIILSTDADAQVPPNWIESMSAYFADPNISATSGTCYINDQSWLDNTIFNIIQPLAMHLHRIVFGNYWLTGSNFAILAEAYRAAGGFNRALNSQEDTQLSFHVAKIGRIAFVRQPSVLVAGRRFKKGIVLGLYDYIRSFVERFIIRKSNVHLDDSR